MMQFLVIDDHPLFLDGLGAILKDFDPSAVVLKATSAEEALDIIEKTHSLDLIFLDLYMPGLDGLSLLKRINAQPVIVPVVIVSSSDDGDLIKQAVDMGVMGFIPKSSSNEQIQANLKSMLEGNTVFPAGFGKIIQGQRNKQVVALASLNLSEKHLQVLQLMAEGFSNLEIAEKLCITHHAVKFRAAKIFRVLKCRSRVEVVLEARRLGLLSH